MINEAVLHSLVLHKIGNIANEEACIFSNKEIIPDDYLKALLTTFFISQFKTEEYFRLSGDDNEIYKSAIEIFDNPDSLVDESVNIARLLYAKTDNPRIKSGEFYTVYFEDCIVDGEQTKAIGLFKSENKETFLKIYPTSGNFILESDEGISLKKPDMGCIIYDTDREEGLLLSVINGKSADMYFNDFIQIKPREDAYNKTKMMMNACKEFVNDRLDEDFKVEKADKIEILSRSMDYFKNSEVFDMPKFEEQVLQQPELIESFRNFDKEWCEQNDIPVEVSFEIEPQAVKKNAKVLKSVLKLDKNFHIYIHGDRTQIEHGEEQGRKYYKIFYEKEL